MTPDVVLMADPRVTSISARTDGPLPLVDVTGVPRLTVDPRAYDAAGAWRLLRAPVRERLAEAAAALPEGLRLRFVEGYRPPALQARYFHGYRERLRAERPGLGEAELHALASRFVSPPEVAPHSAGAAVDLTLETTDGIELDLGTPIDASPEESGGHCYTGHPGVTGAARANRRVLAAALEGAGLVNYPTEWWHWSYGDRYWALATGATQALYDAVPG